MPFRPRRILVPRLAAHSRTSVVPRRGAPELPLRSCAADDTTAHARTRGWLPLGGRRSFGDGVSRGARWIKGCWSLRRSLPIHSRRHALSCPHAPGEFPLPSAASQRPPVPLPSKMRSLLRWGVWKVPPVCVSGKRVPVGTAAVGCSESPCRHVRQSHSTSVLVRNGGACSLLRSCARRKDRARTRGSPPPRSTGGQRSWSRGMERRGVRPRVLRASGVRPATGGRHDV